MKKLSKETLINEYTLFKRRAAQALETGDLEKSLIFCDYCGLVAWRYPILHEFADDELEQLLTEVADQLIVEEETKRREDNENKVLLYASQLIDSGALTEQYLNYFIEHNYQVLVVVHSEENIKYGRNTVKLIEKCPNASIFIAGAKSHAEKIHQIFSKVVKYNPAYAFLHFKPNDVVGYCAFVKATFTKRYYIVHNDHTFWIGKGCSDYFIDFRKFGYLISNQRRKIPHSKLHILPFYPINDKKQFKGFPFEKKDKVIGLSGANLYKYLMDPALEFFHAIKELLQRNPNFIFCLCGYGDNADRILQIFKNTEVEDRFYFLGRRDDFYALIGQTDILFESYPFKGGLTVLFATEQGKPFIGIGNRNNASGCVQDYFGVKDYQEPMTMQEFIAEADLLIKSSDYRHEKAEKFLKSDFNKKSFDRGLTRIIKQEPTGSASKFDDELSISDDYHLNEYITLPNARISFIKEKLFTLKRAMPLRERMASYLTLSPALTKIKVKEAARLLIVIIAGR